MKNYQNTERLNCGYEGILNDLVKCLSQYLNNNLSFSVNTQSSKYVMTALCKCSKRACFESIITGGW